MKKADNALGDIVHNPDGGRQKDHQSADNAAVGKGDLIGMGTGPCLGYDLAEDQHQKSQKPGAYTYKLIA